MNCKSIDFLVLKPVPSDSRANLLDSEFRPTSVIDLETRLNLFVRSSLRKSRSRDYSLDASMKLLDKAWKAQKTLWRLRQQGQ